MSMNSVSIVDDGTSRLRCSQWITAVFSTLGPLV